MSNLRITYTGNDLSRDDLMFQLGVLESARAIIEKVQKNCSYPIYEKIHEVDKLLYLVVMEYRTEIYKPDHEEEVK